MTWPQRFVGACVLAVLALLPAASTVCVAFCHPALATATHPAVVAEMDDAAAASHHVHHHHQAAPVASTADASGLSVSAPPHDCRTHETIVGPSVGGERSSLKATLIAIPFTPVASAIALRPLAATSFMDPASPPTPAPSTTSTVLRI